ncbi:GNAT family N-acetyltransferase [Lewinella sp. IMCC34183]|uniref:GNAT family N-acetyltransferase n=1 Tax=Lewinella sp. IMCC34183 TaxID=2248762 RepID=UPI000E28082C|nr:GNAT family N-acetyltransferase [Lewinella sp. IMCC34183]
MTIRPTTPADRPAIIDLLQRSMGEASTPKSEAYWRWKHEENPFGPSPVLVAEADGRLVGIRAFMRWNWRDGGNTYRALRAVDTATDPDYRGRGIFKKLTLQLVEDCQREGDHFIFNTPNEKSAPGYLKMGWRKLGRLPVNLRPVRPLRLAMALAGLSERPPGPVPATSMDDLFVYETLTGEQHDWYTPRSSAFLEWRYARCPVVDYAAAGSAGKYLVIYYFKEQRWGLEMRVVERITTPGAERECQRAVLHTARRSGAVLISEAPGTVPRSLASVTLAKGPLLTFRPLNFDAPPDVENWSYNLGDMELF